jgi:MOSC domain-containing protein YiiM
MRIFGKRLSDKLVEGAIPVRRLNLDGDRQADLTVHGGTEKAVYAYPVEHYEYWRASAGDSGNVGPVCENLTTQNGLQKDLNIGDQVRVGTALLQVAQPRMPCYKLQVRFDRDAGAPAVRFPASRFEAFRLSQACQEGNPTRIDASG